LGRLYTPRTAGEGAAAGIAIIPEDRKEQALVPFQPIRSNVTVSVVRRLSSHGFLRPKRIRTEAVAITTNVNVRMQSVDQPISSLSGGNQQRAIFGRAFATKPKVLLLDEPTRGVDVGAKAEIYELINKAADEGMAVLVASSELEELLWMCHRIAVMNHGVIVDVIDREKATKERIMKAAAGTITGASQPPPDPGMDGAVA
jgi:ribose transport system ATP-binding protein